MTLTQGLVIGGTQGPAAAGSVGVPDLVGTPRAEAEAALTTLDLVPRVQELEAIGTVGDVFSQDPAPGSVRPKRSVVTLHVIKAPVVPPDLGAKLDDLAAKAAAALAALAAVEKDADAATRHKDLSDKLDKVIEKLDDGRREASPEPPGKKSP